MRYKLHMAPSAKRTPARLPEFVAAAILEFVTGPLLDFPAFGRSYAESDVSDLPSRLAARMGDWRDGTWVRGHREGRRSPVGPLPSLRQTATSSWFAGTRSAGPSRPAHPPSYEVDTSAAMLILLNAGSPPRGHGTPDRVLGRSPLAL